MTTDNRISLREAAKRLTGYPRFKNAQSRGRLALLKLLQSETLRACFDFPSNAQPRINIPARFWIDSPSGDFVAQLTSHSNEGKHGQCLVKSSGFAKQYEAWFSENYLSGDMTDDKRANAAAELGSALAAMSSRKEAYILESEWARFVDASGLGRVEHREDAAKSTRGKRPLQAWEHILVEVASEMLARQTQGHALESEQSKIAAAAVANVEQSTTGLQIPGVDTVVKKIRLILDKRDRILQPAG